MVWLDKRTIVTLNVVETHQAVRDHNKCKSLFTTSIEFELNNINDYNVHLAACRCSFFRAYDTWFVMASFIILAESWSFPFSMQNAVT